MYNMLPHKFYRSCYNDLSVITSKHVIFHFVKKILFLQSSIGKCIEWKPTEVSVDSESHDQEWAMVNTVGRRNRTLSGKFYFFCC